MTATIIDGKQVAADMRAELKTEVAKLRNCKFSQKQNVWDAYFQTIPNFQSSNSEEIFAKNI